MSETVGEFELARSKTRELYKALIHRKIDTDLYDKLTEKLSDIDDMFKEIIDALEENEGEDIRKWYEEQETQYRKDVL